MLHCKRLLFTRHSDNDQGSFSLWLDPFLHMTSCETKGIKIFHTRAAKNNGCNCTQLDAAMSMAFELRICLASAALWWQNETPLMCLTLGFQRLLWTELVARRSSSFCFFSFYFLVIFLPSLKERDGYDGLMDRCGLDVFDTGVPAAAMDWARRWSFSFWFFFFWMLWFASHFWKIILHLIYHLRLC